VACAGAHQRTQRYMGSPCRFCILTVADPPVYDIHLPAVAVVEHQRRMQPAQINRRMPSRVSSCGLRCWAPLPSAALRPRFHLPLCYRSYLSLRQTAIWFNRPLHPMPLPTATTGRARARSRKRRHLRPAQDGCAQSATPSPAPSRYQPSQPIDTGSFSACYAGGDTSRRHTSGGTTQRLQRRFRFAVCYRTRNAARHHMPVWRRTAL